MNQEPISKKDKRDNDLAVFLTKLETANMEDKDKQTLTGDFDKLLDQIYNADTDNTYEVYSRNKQRKSFYGMLFAFIVGVFVSFIPSLIYMHYNTPIIPKFKFVPNAIAEQKPVFVEIVKNQKHIDLIKKSHIRDRELATIGSVIYGGDEGLTIVPKEELELPNQILKKVTPQNDKQIQVEDYTYIPDAIWTGKLYIQILSNPEQIMSARKFNKSLAESDVLEIGGSIACPRQNYCYAQAKSFLYNNYTVKKIEPSFVKK